MENKENRMLPPENYEAPVIETYEVKVERGFAGSPGSTGETDPGGTDNPFQ